MRITVPTIPQVILNAASNAPPISIELAVERIATFVSKGNIAVLTGAGVSVDSGIRAYRGKDGLYMNPNYKPILYNEIVDESPRGDLFRKRYWLRSYLGYPHVRDSLPNPTHFSIAALQNSGHVTRLITQNVDGLHLKAVKMKYGDRPSLLENILELHGTLHGVSCKHGHRVGRAQFQSLLSTANPDWAKIVARMDERGEKPKTNPDGDVEIEGVSYEEFVVPQCDVCLKENRRNHVQKPDLIFFGESIREEVKDRSYRDIERCDSLLIIGTTLATFSAFRLLRHAMDLAKPIMMLNIGPTRAEGMVGFEKIELPSSVVLPEVANLLRADAVRVPPLPTVEYTSTK